MPSRTGMRLYALAFLGATLAGMVGYLIRHGIGANLGVAALLALSVALWVASRRA